MCYSSGIGSSDPNIIFMSHPILRITTRGQRQGWSVATNGDIGFTVYPGKEGVELGTLMIAFLRPDIIFSCLIDFDCRVDIAELKTFPLTTIPLMFPVFSFIVVQSGKRERGMESSGLVLLF